MSSGHNDLTLLLCNPTEPVCLLIKKREKEERKQKEAEIYSKTEAEKVERKESFFESKPPDLPSDLILPDLNKIGKEEHFSVFKKQHTEIAAELIEFFMKIPTYEELCQVAAHCRDGINASLFHYVFQVVVTHRKDTASIRIPCPMAIFPEKFLKADDWAKAIAIFCDKDTAHNVLDLDVSHCRPDLEEEHKLAYFREDLGLNIHHYHWHLVYPDTKFTKKDRQGELFYYMHQQMVARYNFERLSNEMKKVVPLSDWNKPIPEGYFPRLPSTKSGTNWVSRQAGSYIKNATRKDLPTTIEELKIFRYRIQEAIRNKCVIKDNGEEIALDPVHGIDILGSLIDPNKSINESYYGRLHADGHDIISYAHDPEGKYISTSVKEQGVMGDTSTACRDPLFYRWHSYIDSLFQEHKMTLPAYEDHELDFPKLEIKSVDIMSNGTNNMNELVTFWEKSIIDVQKGIDFSRARSEKKVRFQHLQHRKFKYIIKVATKCSTSFAGTVRIFLAPKFDENFCQMSWDEQRTLFVELDKFKVKIDGDDIIVRGSEKSSVTIPFAQQFKCKPENEKNENANYCSCGWPQHLLVPKGNPAGMKCQLFVMISNFEHDEVKVKNKSCCKKAFSYCGVRDEDYPDKRAMGFPFDRKLKDCKNVEDLVYRYDNMALCDVTIKFQGYQ